MAEQLEESRLVQINGPELKPKIITDLIPIWALDFKSQYQIPTPNPKYQIPNTKSQS